MIDLKSMEWTNTKVYSIHTLKAGSKHLRTDKVRQQPNRVHHIILVSGHVITHQNSSFDISPPMLYKS